MKFIKWHIILLFYYFNYFNSNLIFNNFKINSKIDFERFSRQILIYGSKSQEIFSHSNIVFLGKKLENKYFLFLSFSFFFFNFYSSSFISIISFISFCFFHIIFHIIFYSFLMFEMIKNFILSGIENFTFINSTNIFSNEIENYIKSLNSNVKVTKLLFHYYYFL